MKSTLISPYRNEALDKIYNLLFCDQPELFRPSNGQVNAYPWDVLFAASPDADALQKLAADTDAESRTRLLAYTMLANMGVKPQQKELLGVVIEVGLEGGLDVLAAYDDGTARYINQTGAMVVWEAPTNASNVLLDRLFAESEVVVGKIGPWNKPRLSQPSNGDIRLNFLVSDGLYFGQGPFDVLANDPMGAPVIDAATKLMVFLTEQGK
jgi:hypothetical protein